MTQPPATITATATHPGAGVSTDQLTTTAARAVTAEPRYAAVDTPSGRTARNHPVPGRTARAAYTVVTTARTKPEPITGVRVSVIRGSDADAAIAANAQIQDDEILAQEAKLVDTFKTGGMTVIQPDIESFRKPVLAALPPKFESKWGKGLWERISAA